MKADSKDFPPHLQGMTDDEIFRNALLLVAGGLDTTASTMAGMVYFLTKRPDVKAKLLTELKEHFQAEEDINMRNVQDLTYANAFIEEVLRMYPPGPSTMWRITPPGGNEILGEHIPGKVGGSMQKTPNHAIYAVSMYPARYETHTRKSHITIRL